MEADDTKIKAAATPKDCFDVEGIGIVTTDTAYSNFCTLEHINDKKNTFIAATSATSTVSLAWRSSRASR